MHLNVRGSFRRRQTRYLQEEVDAEKYSMTLSLALRWLQEEEVDSDADVTALSLALRWLQKLQEEVNSDADAAISLALRRLQKPKEEVCKVDSEADAGATTSLAWL